MWPQVVQTGASPIMPSNCLSREEFCSTVFAVTRVSSSATVASLIIASLIFPSAARSEAWVFSGSTWTKSVRPRYSMPRMRNMKSTIEVQVLTFG